MSQPRAPYPVRFDGIDDRADDEGIDAVGKELRAFRHGARNDGCGGGAEHEVEEEGRPVVVRKVGEHAEVGDADEAEESVLSHQKPGAEQYENDGAEAEVEQVFHDDVACVFGAGESRFHHGKPCLHEPDEDSADQEPDARRAEYAVHKKYLRNLLTNFLYKKPFAPNMR